VPFWWWRRPAGWRDEERKATWFGTATTSPTTVATNSSSHNNNRHDILNSNECHDVVGMQKEEGEEEEGAKEDQLDSSGLGVRLLAAQHGDQMINDGHL
jgi:hypothetical protein